MTGATTPAWPILPRDGFGEAGAGFEAVSAAHPLGKLARARAAQARSLARPPLPTRATALSVFTMKHVTRISLWCSSRWWSAPAR